MKLKDTIHELCSRLESTLNFIEKEGKNNRVVFLLENNPNIDMPQNWVAVIKLNDQVIYKYTYLSTAVNESPDIIEGLLSERLMNGVFTYGVMSAKKDLDKI